MMQNSPVFTVVFNFGSWYYFKRVISTISSENCPALFLIMIIGLTGVQFGLQSYEWLTKLDNH